MGGTKDRWVNVKETQETNHVHSTSLRIPISVSSVPLPLYRPTTRLRRYRR
nr:hypothetical protein I308_01516 [Cryptococcus tetragattii IND107]